MTFSTPSKFTTALLALVLGTPIAFANTYTVYKSVGTHGEVKYTQTAPKGVKNVEVLQIRYDGRQNNTGELAPPPVDANETAEQNKTSELERRLKEMEERENAQRCRTLRNNLANLNIGGKIYEMDDKGNRTYLNSQEVDTRRTRVQQAISEFCQSSS